MSILTRFKDIMSSNINAALDKMEDPAKMVDQLLRDLNSDLGKVKAETAGIIAQESRARRTLDECEAEITRMQNYAEKAVLAGNDEDARQFLQKKAQHTASRDGLQEAYELASANAAKMRQMHDKLVVQINELNSRKDAIKAKVAVAKTQQRVNQIGNSLSNSQASISKFDRMEEKADRMLDEANAMDELNRSPDSDVAELTKKYDTAPNADDELAALKAKLGK